MTDQEETKGTGEHEEQKGAEKEEKKVGKIKAGDYTVHLLIQKGKEFMIEEGETKDIFV